MSFDKILNNQVVNQIIFLAWFSLLTWLLKLSNNSNVYFCVTGKEAVVLHADFNTENPDFPNVKECAIKVFKTTLSEYKQRDKYIRDDYRFKDRFGRTRGKIATSKLVQLWAEKEMHNLYRLRRAGILCPEVIALKKHVLVMSLIGESNRPAPKLKHAILSDNKNLMAYKQVKIFSYLW